MARREDAPAMDPNAPAKPPKTPKAENGEKKPRGPRVNADAVITITATGNPKRPSSASHTRFEKYRNGMTVKEALANGVTMADVRFDSSKGFIKLSM